MSIELQDLVDSVLDRAVAPEGGVLVAMVDPEHGVVEVRVDRDYWV